VHDARCGMSAAKTMPVFNALFAVQNRVRVDAW
jgi:hypothetical protein